MTSADQEEGVPAGWANCSLSQLVPRTRGKIKPSKSSKLPFVGMDHIEPNSFLLTGQTNFSDMKSAASHFMPGDVLYGRLRPYLNKVHTATFEGASSAEFIVLPEAKTHNSDFLRFLLHQRRFVEYASTGSSGDRPRVDFETIGKFEFKLPPLPEQNRIASKIDELFSRIDAGEAALKRAKALVERYRKSILKAAVTGELTKDWREKKNEKDVSGRTSGNIVYDYLGELPQNWSRVRVDEVGIVQLGRQRSPQHHAGEHMRPYLRVANVFEARFDLSDVMQMNFTPKEYEIYRLQEGDIFLNEGQSKELVGRPALYRNELPGGCFTNTLVRFRSSPLVLPEFALLVFRHYMHDGLFTKIARITTNIAHLGAERFASMSFPLPSLHEQRKILETVESLWSQADAAAGQVFQIKRTSSALKQSVLKEAFRGGLVPQVPNDEPASALLSRIRDSSPLVKSKKAKRGK